MEIVDNTGKPRSDEEILETIQAIKKEIIKGKPQPIMVFYPTIMHGLTELLFRRKVMNLQEEEVKNMPDVYR